MSDTVNGTVTQAHRGILALLCTAQFLLQMNFSIANIALPAIQDDLGFAAAQLQWVITGFALAYGALLLLGGRLGDTFGRRKMLVAGLTVFAVASLACGLAPSPLALTIARLLQGAAGALISPAALSMLTSAYAEGAPRNRALGWWQAAAAGGASAGVVIGGLLTQFLSWEWIFFLNVPIAAVIIMGAAAALPADLPAQRRRLDAAGAALSTASFGAVIFGLSTAQLRGVTAPATLAVLALAVVCGIAFLLVERRVQAPLLPPGFFSAPTHRAADLAMLMMGTVIAAYVYFTSLYLQGVLGTNAVLTGLALLPATVTVMLTSTFGARRMLQRFGVKRVLLAGLGLMCLGQAWLTQLSPDGSYAVDVLPGLLLTALGMGLTLPAASVGATTGVPPQDQGIAGALFTTSQQVGAAMGLAVLATIASGVGDARNSVVAGYQAAYLGAAVILIAAFVVVLIQLNARGCEDELRKRRRAAAGEQQAYVVDQDAR